MDDVSRLPGLGPVIGSQVRYQLTLMLRTPRTLMAGLILPGALLALQLGRVEQAGQGAAADVLAARVAGLVVLGAMSVAYLSHASSLVVAREDGVLRRWRATPLPSWGYFAGRITATVLLADAAGLILVLVGDGHGRPAADRGAIGGLLLAGTLGALALAAAGTAVTPLLTSAQGANPLLTLTYLPLIIFSGGFGGLSGLPHWLNTLMSYLPAQPMIDAVTRALQLARPVRASTVRARPGGAGRLGAGRPAAVGALLPVGSAPAAARAGRRGGEPGPFGMKNAGEAGC